MQFDHIFQVDRPDILAVRKIEILDLKLNRGYSMRIKHHQQSSISLVLLQHRVDRLKKIFFHHLNATDEWQRRIQEHQTVVR